MAERIVVNAKTQRPSVCNAAESIVIHAASGARRSFRGSPPASQTAAIELVGDDTCTRPRARYRHCD